MWPWPENMYLNKPVVSISLFFTLSAILIISSCNNHPRKPGPTGFSDETFSSKLQALLKPVDTAGKKYIRSVYDELRITYQSDDYQPIWVKQNFVPTPSAAKLLDELEDMTWDGFNPERYNVAALRKLKIKLDTTKANSIADAITFDTGLTNGFLAAAKDLLLGRIIPKKVDSLWFHVNDSTWSAPQMLVNSRGVCPSLEDFRSKVSTYQLLREEYKRFKALGNDSNFINSLGALDPAAKPDKEMIANIDTLIKLEMPWVIPVHNDTVSEQKQLVMAYQNFTSIPVTGRLDSITLARLATPIDSFLDKLRANMERIRWMQQKFGNTYIVVNIPLMEFYLKKDTGFTMHMRVVVGKPERQTPSLFANMANVVINPEWGVPPTILRKDVIPGLEKSGKKYLLKKGLRAYDKEGKPVQASLLNARNYKKFSYKQPPGDDNSLGYVKFNLPNPWDIYLHDTPHRDDFVKRMRALSSGCVRLQRPLDLAVYILGELEKRNFTPGKLDTMISTHKTRYEVLKNKIPVHITYLTAFEDTTGKHIRFARDIYHRDDKLINSLN